MHRHDPAPLRAPQNPSRGSAPSRRAARSARPAPFSFKPPLALLLAFSALFILLATARALFPADDSYYHVTEIKPHVFVWVAEDIIDQEGDPQFKRAGNAGFIITQDGVVVVNTTNTPFNARSLLYEIRKRTDLPVRYVINTSASPDVMLGNEAFEDFKPVFLSTPPAALAMHDYRNEFPARLERDWRLAASMRGIHPLPPTETFDKEMTLPLSGQPIQVINLGDNASPGDAVVYLPQSKVLFLGNLFENEYIPRIGAANIDHWIETLRKVESWDAEVCVPGHGLPGGKAQVAQFRQFIEWLTGQVRAGMQQGKNVQQLQNELVPFQNIHWHAPELEADAVAAVYRLLARQTNQAVSSVKSEGP